MESRLTRFYAELAQYQPGQDRAAYEAKLRGLGGGLLPSQPQQPCAPSSLAVPASRCLLWRAPLPCRLGGTGGRPDAARCVCHMHVRPQRCGALASGTQEAVINTSWAVVCRAPAHALGAVSAETNMRNDGSYAGPEISRGGVGAHAAATGGDMFDQYRLQRSGRYHTIMATKSTNPNRPAMGH